MAAAPSITIIDGGFSTAFKIGVVLSGIVAVATFRRICTDMERIPGSPKIGEWTTDRPFYPFLVLRAHSRHFPKLHLAALYLLTCVVYIASYALVQRNGLLPLWLTLYMVLCGGSIAAIRLLAPNAKPFFVIR